MGIAIPQVIAEDRASGAQVIDGSIVFDRSRLKHLKRTISTTGNQRTFTVSAWFKQCRFQDQQYLFTSEYLGSGNEYFELTLSAGYQLQLYNSKSAVVNIKPSALLRDTAWYHIVVAVDTTVSPAEDRVKFYINGERQTDFAAGHSAFPAENYAFELSNSRDWFIGAAEFSNSIQGHYDGPMSNFYFVDGQALRPEEFGFTDPLTNTWRPKKYDTTAPTNNPNNNTTWSNNVTASSGGFGTGEEVTKGFDGDLTTKCKTNTNGADINITFSGISVEKLLRIRTNYTNGQNSTITVNGTNYGAATTASDGEYKVISGFTGPLTSIVLSADSAVNASFSAIEVDGVILQDATTTNNRTWDGSITFGTNGFYLPMDGNSPIGEDKSGNLNINDGTIWSKDVTTSNGYAANRDPSKGFDGNSSLVGQSDTYVQSDTSAGGTVTWTPNGYTIDTADEILVKGISSLDRLSVVGSLGSQSNITPATVNGVTNVYTIPTNLGTLTSLTVTGNSSLAGWSGITVGGILLVNGLKGNSWTPVNFSGSSAIDKATGALPILNTTNGGRVATVGVRTDATVAAGVGTCVLAVPMAGQMPGNYTDVSNQIDSRSSVKTVTADDNADFSTDTSIFYSGSFKFDGTSDKVSISDHDELDGFGDFTIEMWWYCSTLNSGEYLLAKGNSYMPYMIYNSGLDVLQFFASSNNTSWDIANGASFGSSIPMLNKWNHIAVTREGSTGRLFLNGVQTDTFTSSLPLMTNGDNVTVFADSTGGAAPIGYAQDLRIYSGVAKYTSNFIPASTNPDILPDTPSGVSGGSKLAKITDTEGAVAFDGNGDSLRVEDHVDFTFGGGDYTMEAFVYIDSSSTGWNALVTKYSTNTQSDRSWWWGMNNGRQEFYQLYNNGLNNLNATSPKVIYGKWTHCAVAREGSTIRIFDDGQLSATIDLSSVPSSQTMTDGSGPLVIGQDADSNTYDMDGFISNVRVIKGTALYTSNFTPPSAPLTNVTNTKLLCCQSVAEQQNNFIRMFKSSTLYTTKADILANATEIGDGATLSNEYWYIIPTGDEPIGSDVFTNDGSITTPHASNNFALYWRNGSSWTQTIGTYGPSEYSDFDYKSDDSSSTYSVYPARDFYVFGADASPPEPKLISGTLPTRAKYYKFNGAVKPGTITANGDAAATNFNPFITDINTVRGQETGYCTFNALRERTAGYNPSFGDGNLFMDGRGDGTGTLSASSGKFYYEVLIDTVTNNSQMYIGVQDAAYPGAERGWSTAQIAAIRDQAAFYGDGSTGTAVGYGAGDLLSFAFDADDNKLYIAKNGIYMNGGNPSQGTGFTHSGINFAGGYTPLVSDSNVGQKFRVNFGQKPFKFPPPDGFQPLNAANIRPETVIARPDQYVGVTTYSGNGDSDALADTAIDTSTAYRYHRILFEGDNNGGSVSEIEFYDANGNKIDASDTNNAGNSVATNATQGLDGWTAFNGTRGGSDYSQGVRKDAGVGAVGFYISKDWGSGQTKTIYGVKVWGVNSYGLAGNTTNKYMKLQGSNDNSNWTDLQTWNSARTGSWTTDSANQVGHISDQTIYNPIKLGMQPDLVWIKKTSGSNEQNRLVDSVRGPNEELYSDTDQNSGSNNGLNSFDPDGFTVWTSNAGYNEFGQDYVAWSWKAGGEVGVGRSFMIDGVGFSTAGDAGFNPQATEIAPDSASISTKTGFSIVKYSGSTTAGVGVLHGLSQKPDFVIVKNITSNTTDWMVWTSAFGDNKNLRLNQIGDRAFWDDGFIAGHLSSNTAMTMNNGTTSALDVNTGGVNPNDYIMYSWHNVPGLQKFGFYTGNGNANGPYVELGFRPALVIVKYAHDNSGSGNWYIFDSKMVKYNPINKHLVANSPGNIGTGYPIDFLSNGFKLRYADTAGHTNLGTTQFIYAAWAESPAINLYGGQSNAR